MKWEYQVQSFNMADRWSKKMAEMEVERFQNRLNSLGEDSWEMVSYESVPQYGSFSNKLKGHAYLLFMKRPKAMD
jgi:hypothetical protein